MNAIIQNISTILAAVIVFGVIFAVSFKLYRNKKMGKSSCSGCKDCNCGKVVKNKDSKP